MENHLVLHQAMTFATLAHQGQKRKGTGVDYIVHPMEVAQILTDAGADENVIIAGVLHDTVEDTDVTLEDLREEFGDAVADLVKGASEDKSKTWRERKAHTIAFVQKEATKDQMILACADKLANMRSTYISFKKDGEGVWARFNAGKDDQAWYYDQLIDAFEPLSDYKMYWELSHLFNAVFVDYYISPNGDEMIQVMGDQCYRMEHDKTCTWEASKVRPSEDDIPLSYDEAAKVEQEWIGPRIPISHFAFKLPMPAYDGGQAINGSKQALKGIAQGMFSDGRPYYVELWMRGSTELIMCRFSAVDFLTKPWHVSENESENLNNAVVRYLEEEGAIYFPDQTARADFRIVKDQVDQPIYVGFVIVEDEEDGVLAETSFEFWEPHTYVQPQFGQSVAMVN